MFKSYRCATVCGLMRIVNLYLRNEINCDVVLASLQLQLQMYSNTICLNIFSFKNGEVSG